MAAKDKLDSQSIIQSKNGTSRSIFDFSSVEDFRPTNDDQESNRVFSDKTQATKPFNKSYIAHAPSRQLFTLNSRCTFFGGHGGSSKDISGSAEELTGHTSTMKRNSNLGKFNKSSPDLRYSSYQMSDGDHDTKQERQEGLDTELNIETNHENEKERGNQESTKRGKNNEFDYGNVGGIWSSTETKLDNKSMVKLETKWTTRAEFEARSQLSMNTLNVESTSRNTTSTDDAMTNDKNTTSHVFYPEPKHFDDSSTSEISAARYTEPETSEVFDKSGKTILHSGKAELRKSSESLNSFRRGGNSRENVDFTDDFTDSVVLQESEVTEATFEHAFGIGKNTMEYEIGTKRNDEMAGLDVLLWPEKRQKTSQKSENDVFSQFSKGSSSYSELTMTVVRQSSCIDTTTKQDLKWMTSFDEQESTNSSENTNRVTKTESQESKQSTANESEEKEANENEKVTLTYMENNKEVANVDTGAELGDYNNIVVALKTQPKTLYENPPKEATVKKNISDLHAGSTTARKGKNNCDKDFLLDQEPETTLSISDTENGKPEKVDEGRNTEVNIGEGFILQTRSVQQLLVPTPKDYEEDFLKLSESDEFVKQEETIVRINMGETNAMLLSANSVDLLMSNDDENLERVSQESTTTETKNQSMKNTIITTRLNINRNKWSHSFIIPRRTINIPNSKMVPGTVNVLVLDSDLTLTSPERKPTVIKLNLFPRETGGTNSRGYNNEISQACIQMNVEKETIYSREDDNISDLLHAENEIVEDIIDQKSVEPEQIWYESDFQSHPGRIDYTKQLDDEHFISNDKLTTSVSLVNDDMKVQKHSKTQQLVYLVDESTTNTTFTGNAHENSLTDSHEKETNESINDPIVNKENFKNMQTDHFTKLESYHQVQERVCKVDVKGMNDERLSEHLMSFEMDELVHEKIIKQESKQQEFLPQLDEILIPKNEIREKISKEERDSKYELSSELDALLNLEETQDNEAENNSCVILSRNDEVYSSEFIPQNAVVIEDTQNMEEQNSTQSENKVFEVLTKTVEDKCLQNKYLPHLDEMLEYDHLQKFVSEKMGVKHDKQDYLLETDRYFDFIKTAQLPVREKIDNTQLAQCFELPKQILDPGQQVKRDEQSNGDTSELILYQNNEDIETEEGRINDGLYAWVLNTTENAFDITVNQQDATPTEESMSMSSKDSTQFNTNDNHLALVISHSNNSRVTIHSQEDDDIRLYTASPSVDESSSVVTNYDASGESSSESTENYTQQHESEEDLTDEEDYVPWDINVSYLNPETMKSGLKVLRASYSNIRPEVHQIESESTYPKISIDGKVHSPHTRKRTKISEQRYEIIEASSHPKLVQSAENNLNSDMDATLNGEILMDNKYQYRTTMDIQLNQNRVRTSYVVLQRLGKEDSLRTYFELNYDMDEWKVGKKITSHEKREPQKTFAVSYATIEQVNNSQRVGVYLPKIEEATDDEGISNPFLSKELTPTKVPLISPSTPQPVELNNNEFSSTKELLVFQIPSTSEEIIFNQSPPISPSISLATQAFHNDDQTRADILKSSTSSSPPLPSSLLPTTTKDGSPLEEVQHKEINSYVVQQQIYVPTKELVLENISYLPLPPEASATTKDVQLQENYHHLSQIVVPPKEKNWENIFYPQVPPRLPTPQRTPTTTHTEVVQQEELNHYLPPKELRLENMSCPPPPPPTPQTQAPLTSFTEKIQQEKIKRHLLEKYPPTETSTDLDTKMPNQHKVSVHSQVPSLLHKQPVWTFARSVFHTDGKNKTFFKVIDDRNKYFQSSTFMYGGDRVKVCRGVNIIRSDFENRTQDIIDEQTMHCRVDEDYEEYSEIWDDGNLLPDESEVMFEVDGPVTRSEAFYKLATEQDSFNEHHHRNCSWYLKLHGNFGVGKLSPNNLDAIAIEDDNTLLGSRGFVSGHHTWVIQGLGIFCAVGVCCPGEDVRPWFKGGKWVWTTDGLRYSEPHGIQRSKFGQWRNEDVLEISLNCEDHKLTILNTKTNVEATLHGFEGEVYPYFNIYKGSSIRLLETSTE